MMEWFKILMERLRALFRRESVLKDIEEELRVHIEMETETNIKRGMSPDEARAAAMKSFGNVGRNTELGYDIRGGGRLETLWQDLRYGARILMKNSGFTLIAIITLALTIGANSAIFSIINANMLNPLPFDDLDRIVMVWEKAPGQDGERNSVSVANYLDWREQSKSFVNPAICMYWSANLSGVNTPERVRGYQVSPNLLDALGVKVALGRNFLPDEDQPGKDNVVILTHGLWQRSFGGDPNVVGRTANVNGAARTIIGVMPPEVNFPVGVELLAPTATPSENTFALLAPGGKWSASLVT